MGHDSHDCRVKLIYYTLITLRVFVFMESLKERYILKKGNDFNAVSWDR